MKYKVKMLLVLVVIAFSVRSKAQDILNGTPITMSQAPYQVMVGMLGNPPAGGGVILSDRWILVAAHGPDGWGYSPGSSGPPAQVFVVAGAVDPMNIGAGQTRYVDKVIAVGRL